MSKTADRILREAGYLQPWHDDSQAPPQTILALAEYAAQRPGLEPEDYGCARDYRDTDPNWREYYMQDSRRCTAQFQDVKKALRECYLLDVTDQDIIEAAPIAFSGRLEVTQEADKVKLSYTAGQYAPTEYRAAIAAVLEQAARTRIRANEAAARERHA